MFIKSKLSASGSSSGTKAASSGVTSVAAASTSAAKPTVTYTSAAATTTSASTPINSSTAGTVAKYGQCGGSGYKGAVKCAAGSTCKAYNAYYSQCQ